jgi:hypothetical protein
MNKKESKGGLLEYAVYGGICGLLGILSIIVLFFAVLECTPAVINAIIRRIISTSLALLTIHFGWKSQTKEGKSVITLGIIIILVIITYIFGIIPCIATA